MAAKALRRYASRGLMVNEMSRFGRFTALRLHDLDRAASKDILTRLMSALNGLFVERYSGPSGDLLLAGMKEKLRSHDSRLVACLCSLHTAHSRDPFIGPLAAVKVMSWLRL